MKPEDEPKTRPTALTDAIEEARALDGEHAADCLRAFELVEVFAAHVDAQAETWKQRSAQELVKALA